MLRLKELRKEKGLLQKDVADYLGVDRTTYARYENGDSNPNIDMLLALSEYFAVSVDYLVGKADNNTITDLGTDFHAAWEFNIQSHINTTKRLFPESDLMFVIWGIYNILHVSDKQTILNVLCALIHKDNQYPLPQFYEDYLTGELQEIDSKVLNSVKNGTFLETQIEMGQKREEGLAYNKKD